MCTCLAGYGDVSSKGTPQRIFGVFAMVIGALLFGYGVSNVVNIVEELRSGERMFRENLDKFNQYMRAQAIPLPLQDAVREYLTNVRRVQEERISVGDEIALLSQLSSGLREEIAIAVNHRYLEEMPFFVGEDPTIVMDLAFSMERCNVGPDEVVIKFGATGNEMYFILEGRVEVLIPVAPDSPAGHRDCGKFKRVAELGRGQSFGEMALLSNQLKRTATVRTLTFSEFRCLSSSAFNVIVKLIPSSARAW
jgi:hyperpolarization activated cyclic nucleotide-gated potassium channel 2